MTDFLLSSELLKSTSQGTADARLGSVIAEVAEASSSSSDARVSIMMAETVSQKDTPTAMTMRLIMKEVITTVRSVDNIVPVLHRRVP